MGHTLGWGNSYSEIVRDGSGIPTALWPLHPGTTRAFHTEAGELLYEDINTGKRYLPENILHVAGLGFDGLTGYSPVTLARQAIGLGIGAEQFGATLFGNGAVPKGILEVPKKLSEMAAKKLRESWENVHGGSGNANRTAVLEEGITWKNTSINPDDAQFLLTRKFQVNEVARIFNIPPHKIGDYSESHRANVEESNLDYLTTTLQGWLESIEAEYDAKLLFDDERDELCFSHNMNALMRGNMAARGSYYESRFRVGSISPDEIRTAEGEDPIGPDRGGDQYLIQSQYIPLDQASQVMAAKSGAQPQPPEPPPSPPNPAKRFNHNHGQDGKFSSGSGGGGRTLASGPLRVGDDVYETHELQEVKDQAAAIGNGFSPREDWGVVFRTPDNPREASSAAKLDPKGAVMVRRVVSPKTSEREADGEVEHIVAGRVEAVTRPAKAGKWVSDTNPLTGVGGRKSFGSKDAALEHSRKKVDSEVKAGSEVTTKVTDGGSIGQHLDHEKATHIGSLPAEKWSVRYHVVVSEKHANWKEGD
jgi:HK97 family phage portal protein